MGSALLLLPVYMDEIGLGKDDEAGLGLNDAHGLGWYDEQGLAEAEPPIISIRSTSLQPYKKQKQLAWEHARLKTYIKLIQVHCQHSVNVLNFQLFYRRFKKINYTSI